jgi:hypothetical protein
VQIILLIGLDAAGRIWFSVSPTPPPPLGTRLVVQGWVGRLNLLYILWVETVQLNLFQDDMTHVLVMIWITAQFVLEFLVQTNLFQYGFNQFKLSRDELAKVNLIWSDFESDN